MAVKNDIQTLLNAIVVIAITIILTALTMEKGFGIPVKSWAWLSSLIIANGVIVAMVKKIY